LKALKFFKNGNLVFDIYSIVELFLNLYNLDELFLIWPILSLQLCSASSLGDIYNLLNITPGIYKVSILPIIMSNSDSSCLNSSLLVVKDENPYQYCN
jgi:hypothetical protein